MRLQVRCHAKVAQQDLAGLRQKDVGGWWMQTKVSGLPARRMLGLPASKAAHP